MKKWNICVILILLFATFGIAQTTQKGYVKTKGRIDSKGQLVPGKRIPSAAIQLSGGHSTVGDANGDFKLTVPAGKFYLNNVLKQGYVLSDPDMLKKQYSCTATPLVITMETPEKQLADQLASERKLRRNLQAQLQQREREIDSLLENHKLTEDAYHQALQALYAEQENNERLIADMAKRYAGLDYDLLDEFYRQVSFFIENGELLKADSLLRSRGDLRAQVLEHQQKSQILQEQRERLQKAEQMYVVDKEELARRCYSYFEKYSAQFQNDSAAYYLELRAGLDTTNVEWQLDAGSFIDDYMADMGKAVAFYQRALRQSIKQNGETHPAVATAYNNLAGVYQNQGEYEHSKAFYQKSLTIMKSLYGDNHPNVATCYNNIGFVYKTQGEYTQAMEYYQKSLEISKSVFGEIDPNVATSHNNIGGVLYSRGEYSQALEQFQSALNISRSLYGENHPDVAICYNNIGLVHYSQGEYDQAMEYYQKALNIRKSVYGEEHPEVATLYNNIGLVYYSQGEFAQAMSCYQKTLSISKSVYGENHPDVATSYNNIGLVCYLQGEYLQALDYFQKELVIYKSIYGENHPDVATNYNNIGGVYKIQGDYEQALKYYQQSLDIWKSVNGDNHPNVATGYNNIGNVCYHQGEYQKALEYFQKALDILKVSYGEEHPDVKFLKESVEIVKKKMEDKKQGN
ncbi:MAG: tetratricopeptide repeat protein [Bacteroidales bacterium]|nr:tetratricopeptide repeat protein [Bacteroidales bacterium]